MSRSRRTRRHASSDARPPPDRGAVGSDRLRTHARMARLLGRVVRVIHHVGGGLQADADGTERVVQERFAEELDVFFRLNF